MGHRNLQHQFCPVPKKVLLLQQSTQCLTLKFFPMKSSIRKAKVSFDFQKMNASGLATFGDGTVAGLTGNTAFPNPVVALATVTTQVNAVRDTERQIAAGNISKALTAQLKLQTNILMLSLSANGHYVEDISNMAAAGDENKAEQLILSSGFKLKKKAVPHPRDFEVVETGAGWIHLRAKKAGAKKQESHLWRFGIAAAKGTVPASVMIRTSLEADIIIADIPGGVVLAAQHASVLSASHTKKTSAAATQTSKAATPVPISKARHPIFSFANSDPYQWTDFIYAVIP
jgi:hypothetical protein